MNTRLMRTFVCAGIAVSTAIPAWPQEEIAPRHEVGLTLGGFFTTDRHVRQTRVELGSGLALQANYGYKFLEGTTAALYGEVHFLASPQRLVSSSDLTLTRDVATLFVTPGIRVKFFPRSAVSPIAGRT